MKPIATTVLAVITLYFSVCVTTADQIHEAAAEGDRRDRPGARGLRVGDHAGGGSVPRSEGGVRWSERGSAVARTAVP